MSHKKILEPGIHYPLIKKGRQKGKRRWCIARKKGHTISTLQAFTTTLGCQLDLIDLTKILAREFPRAANDGLWLLYRTRFNWLIALVLLQAVIITAMALGLKFPHIWRFLGLM